MLTLLLIAAALAQEPRTVSYEFPEVEPVMGELVKPTISFVLPSSLAFERACPETTKALLRQRRKLARRGSVADRREGRGDMDRCEAQLLERALYTRWDEAWAAGEPTPDTALEEATIAALRGGAIALYGQALAEPSVEDPDRLLLKRAMLASALQDDAVMEEALEALVRDHPDSPHATTARFMLGELAFAQVAPAWAIPWYQEVSTEDHQLAPMAAYKLAWCLLMDGDEDAGVRQLLAIASGPEDDPLAQAARDDLARLEAPTGTR